MNIAILDDDLNFESAMSMMVAKICEKHKIECFVMSFSSPRELLFNCEYRKYDLILLDIEMPEVNGLEFAEKLNIQRDINEPPYVVFVTGKDNLVFEALKKFPYSFVRKTQLQDIEECIINIYKKIHTAVTHTIRMGRAVKVVDINKIIRLEKQGNYVYFYTTEGKFQERCSIDEKYKELKEHWFMRPHIGFLVNPAYIQSFDNTDLLMSDGTQVPISRNYKKELKSNLHTWMVKRK